MTPDTLARSGAKPSHALYPGTFDVLTYGHLDVLRRAVRLFDQVTIAVAINPAKQQMLFSVEERVDMIRKATARMQRVAVAQFTGLTVDFARQIKASVILRGLRAVSDFEFELQMAMMNENLMPSITTLFMAPSPQYIFLSSSAVKEIARFNGDVSQFVPPHVAQCLYRKIHPIRISEE